MDKKRLPILVLTMEGGPDNFLHLFEGVIRMQKWLMPIACHMLTYTLKDFARIWWNSQKAGSILNYEDLKAKFRSHFSQQNKFTKTHLAVHNIKQEAWSSISPRTSHPLTRVWWKKPTHGSKQEKWQPTELLMIEGKTLKDQENPLRTIIEDRKVGIGRSFEQPPRMFGNRRSRDMSKYCHFYEDHMHETNDCRQLRNQIEETMKSGQLFHLVKGIKKERVKASENQRVEGKKDKGTASAEAPILMIRRKSWSSGEIPLEITIGDAPLERKETLNFVIVKFNFPYNMLLGRTVMQKMGVVVSTIHGAIKFHTTKGIGTVFSTYESYKVKEGMKKVRETPLASEKGGFSCTVAEEKVVVNNKYPEQTITIEKRLPKHFKRRLHDLLRANVDVFALTHADMTGIPRAIVVEGKPFNIEHKLNEYSHVKPIKQKRRGLGLDHSTAACKEVEELTKAGILQKVKHQTWVANPVMVRKSDEGWRMCVSFTDINKACPKTILIWV
ncbi:hypothetical protein Tco_0226729 [Tanacetum coccineum]